jgi:Arc/MetJ-type ribon-helix-helix transcriptional regulator
VPTTQIAIRVSDEQVRQIDELVPTMHATRSELVRRALDAYLYRLACARDADIYARVPLTEDELALGDATLWSEDAPGTDWQGMFQK